VVKEEDRIPVRTRVIEEAEHGVIGEQVLESGARARGHVHGDGEVSWSSRHLVKGSLDPADHQPRGSRAKPKLNAFLSGSHAIQ
jgi:hypothetical protein